MIPQAVTPPEPTLNWQVRRVIESVDAGRERARDVLFYTGTYPLSGL